MMVDCAAAVLLTVYIHVAAGVLQQANRLAIDVLEQDAADATGQKADSSLL